MGKKDLPVALLMKKKNVELRKWSTREIILACPSGLSYRSKGGGRVINHMQREDGKQQCMHVSSPVCSPETIQSLGGCRLFGSCTSLLLCLQWQHEEEAQWKRLNNLPKREQKKIDRYNIAYPCMALAMNYDVNVLMHLQSNLPWKHYWTWWTALSSLTVNIPVACSFGGHSA